MDFENLISNLSLKIPKLQNPFENFAIPEKKIHKSILAIDELALKYGWVSDWGDFTPAEVYELLEKWSEVTDCEEEQKLLILNFFFEYYSAQNFQQIKLMIDNWTQNPIFNNRIMIFRDCLFALQNTTEPFNPSNLVVPVLISQVDGIIQELLEREGWTFNVDDYKWSHPNHSIKQNSEKCFVYLIDKKRNCLGDGYIGKLVQTNSRHDILIKGLFQQALHGEKLNNPSFISRHKILHGEYVNYGTLENTLQLFLILNYLHDFNVSRLTNPDDSDVVETRKF